MHLHGVEILRQIQILKTLKCVAKFSNKHVFYIYVCKIGYVKKSYEKSLFIRFSFVI